MDKQSYCGVYVRIYVCVLECVSERVCESVCFFVTELHRFLIMRVGRCNNAHQEPEADGSRRTEPSASVLETKDNLSQRHLHTYS